MALAFRRRYDAVVVGGGNGGLTAACQLAAKGRSVLLLEQHNTVGGFSSSFVRGRFEFEASLHVLCDLGPAERPGSVRRMFGELGVEVDWLPVPEAYRVILLDKGVDATMPFGLEAFLDAMEAKVPGSRKAMAVFLELCGEISGALDYLGSLEGKPSVMRLLRDYPNFLKTAAYSVEEVARALDLPQEVKDLLYPYWSYLGIPASRMNMTLYGAMVYLFLTQGGFIPRRRSTEIASALEARIRELGGAIERNTLAEKILVEGGRAVGVRTARGEDIGAGQVICNCSPTKVYREMIESAAEVRPELGKWASARQESVSAVTVYLGLDASAEKLGLREYSYLISRDMDTERIYESFRRFGPPQAMAAVCLNNVIPDCSPQGTSIVTMTALCKSEAWRGIGLSGYFAAKDQMARWLIEEFEAATGSRIRDNIEEIEVAAPATFARYAAAPQGIIYGYETDSWDSALPRMMMLDEDELIEGLRFAGGYGAQTIGYNSALCNGRAMGRLADEDIGAAEEAER